MRKGIVVQLKQEFQSVSCPALWQEVTVLTSDTGKGYILKADAECTPCSFSNSFSISEWETLHPVRNGSD